MLILFYTIQQVIPNICTKFQNPMYSSSWEIFDTNFPMYYIGVRDEKTKNGKRRQKLITASWFSFPQYTWSLSMCIQNLKTLAVIGAENYVTKILLERKKNGQIKGMISSCMLILFYTIQQVIPNICTKFQNPMCSSSWEIFDTNFPMYYTGVRDWKKQKWKKKEKTNHSILVFFPTIYLALLKVYTKFEDSGSHRSQDFYDGHFYWRERKMDK